jgi:hypothetical protein
MTMTIKTTRTAEQAYMAERTAALAFLARITEAIENHDDALAQEINCGHVGDMAETRKTLGALADRLFAEGEYAPAGR